MISFQAKGGVMENSNTYVLQHSCRCEIYVDLGWLEAHPVKADWIKTVPCKKCWAKEKLQDALKIKKKFALPDLSGSEKQINWC